MNFLVMFLALHLHTSILSRAKNSTIGQETPLTEVQLQQFYRGFNEVYFDGKLPDVPVRYSVTLHSKFDASAMTTCEDGDKTGKTCRITIAAELAPFQAEVLENELHEMCHVSLEGVSQPDGDHGWKFQRCMKRLASANALEGIW